MTVLLTKSHNQLHIHTNMQPGTVTRQSPFVNTLVMKATGKWSQEIGCSNSDANLRLFKCIDKSQRNQI